MKPATLFLAGVTFIVFAAFASNGVSSNNSLPDDQEDLITACQVLKKVTASSNPQSEQANIIVYRNAYKLLRAKVADKNRIALEDRYFNELAALNSASDRGVVISYNAPPKGIGGGWTHNEVDSLLEKIERGLTLRDIETTIKLKETFDIRDLRQGPRQSPVIQRP
jgi:hypothetical protein